MQLPDSLSDMPDWAQTAVTLLLGAGGFRWYKAWLEDRRLSKKEYRETLMERIQELETVVNSMHTRMGNLRVEMAHLQVENKQLRHELESVEEEIWDDE